MIINAFILEAEDFLEWCSITPGLYHRGTYSWSGLVLRVRFNALPEAKGYRVQLEPVGSNRRSSTHTFASLHAARHFLEDALGRLSEGKDPVEAVLDAHRRRDDQGHLDQFWAQLASGGCSGSGLMQQTREGGFIQQIQRMRAQEDARFMSVVDRIFDED